VIEWAAHHPIPFFFIVVVAMLVLGTLLQRVLPEKWSSLAVAVLIPVVVTVQLNHVLAVAREGEQRRFTLRLDHLARLRPILKAESANFGRIVKQIGAAPRVTDLNKDEASNLSELQGLLFSDPLSKDLANHFTAYSEAKDRLSREIQDQDGEHRREVFRLSRMASLAPEDHRGNVALALLWKCIGLGPGMTLTVEPKGGYHYSLMSGSSNNSSGSPPPEIVAAFRAFTAFRADEEFEIRCASLKARAVRIAETARGLQGEALVLSETPSLSGTCRYTGE
jgi:hypothetical protein